MGICSPQPNHVVLSEGGWGVSIIVWGKKLYVDLWGEIDGDVVEKINVRTRKIGIVV